MSITFEEYDEISEILSGINKQAAVKLLNKEAVDAIFQYDSDYFLGILIWILESVKEKNQSYDYLNKMACAYIEFDDQSQNSIGESISEEKTKILETIAILNKYTNPDEFINDDFLNIAFKYPYYFIGMFYWILACSKRNDKLFRRIRNLLNEEKSNIIRVPAKELEKISNTINNVDLNDNWFPSVEDINTYILPNISICLDFMLFYLKKPEEAWQKKSRDLMKKIIYENFEFEGGYVL